MNDLHPLDSTRKLASDALERASSSMKDLRTGVQGAASRGLGAVSDRASAAQRYVGGYASVGTRYVADHPLKSALIAAAVILWSQGAMAQVAPITSIVNPGVELGVAGQPISTGWSTAPGYGPMFVVDSSNEPRCIGPDRRRLRRLAAWSGVAKRSSDIRSVRPSAVQSGSQRGSVIPAIAK